MWQFHRGARLNLKVVRFNHGESTDELLSDKVKDRGAPQLSQIKTLAYYVMKITCKLVLITSWQTLNIHELPLQYFSKSSETGRA